MVKLENLITLDSILFDIQATDKKSAIAKLCSLLHVNGKVTDDNALAADIMQNETLEATNLGIGIALPRGKSASVREVSVAVGRLQQSISWDNEGEEVDALMLVAIPEHDTEVERLSILHSLSTMLKEITFISNLYNATTKEELMDSIDDHIDML